MKDHAALEKRPAPPKEYQWWVAQMFDDPLPIAFMGPNTLDPENLPKTLLVWRLTNLGLSDPEGKRWGVKPWWPMIVGAIDHWCWMQKFSDRVQSISTPGSAAMTMLDRLWDKDAPPPIATATEAQAAMAAADQERAKKDREAIRVEALALARKK